MSVIKWSSNYFALVCAIKQVQRKSNKITRLAVCPRKVKLYD